MNLVKDLQKVKETSIDFSKELNKETQLLLESNSDLDKQILNNSGLNKNLLNYESDKKSNYLEREALDNKYDGDVFTEQEIKNIAIKYCLKFLPSKYYQGEVAAFVPVKLREFLDKAHLSSGQDLQHKLFVLAPHKCFNLQDKPVPVRNLDPILFYEVRVGVYKMVTKWGKDLTIWNYIKAIRRRSEGHYDISNICVLAILLNIVLFTIFPLISILFSLVSIGIASLLYAAIMGICDFPTNTEFSSDTNWNTTYKMRGI